MGATRNLCAAAEETLLINRTYWGRGEYEPLNWMCSGAAAAFHLIASHYSRVASESPISPGVTAIHFLLLCVTTKKTRCPFKEIYEACKMLNCRL